MLLEINDTFVNIRHDNVECFFYRFNSEPKFILVGNRSTRQQYEHEVFIAFLSGSTRIFYFKDLEDAIDLMKTLEIFFYKENEKTIEIE